MGSFLGVKNRLFLGKKEDRAAYRFAGTFTFGFEI